MNFCNYFAFLFAIFSCILTCMSSEFRIVRGHPWKIEDSPYLVSIHHKGRNHCVGSLVSMQKVVTAANCVVNFYVEDFTVVAGVANLRDIRSCGQTRDVELIYYPCDYNPRRVHMDIAVMAVRKLFNPSLTVKEISFCGASLRTGRDIRISGWGWTDPKNGKTTEILQSTVLTTLSKTTCARKVAISAISDTMICAARGKTDACYEDFGGPGVVDEELCAVLSHNKGCSGRFYPNVFTDVTNKDVQEFLNEVMDL